MILVTAPTGNIGRHVVRQLVDAKVSVRVLARDPAKIDVPVEVVQGDLDQPDTLDAALRGVDQLCLIAPGPDVVRQDAAAIAAAQRANLAQVVMVSSLGAELGGIAGGKGHLPGEQLLRESGLSWTLLRPSEFMTNLLWMRPTIANGVIPLPAGSGAIGFVDPEDIAAVAVHALRTPGHEGQTYRLTGPEALRIADIAAQLAEILEKPVHHLDIPPEAYAEAIAGRMPPFMIATMVEYYAAVREGRVSVVASDVQDLLGRPARSFGEWARAAFR